LIFFLVGITEHVKEKLDQALWKKQAEVGIKLSYDQFITWLIEGDKPCPGHPIPQSSKNGFCVLCGGETKQKNNES
jgi:hypothetical protein